MHKDVRSRCSLWVGKKWATFPISGHDSQTNVPMKTSTEGGFSSKLRIESLTEFGHEARTHRPSPSSSIQKFNITHTDKNLQEEISRNKVSVLESALG